MPAKEPSGDHPSIGPSSTHSWLSPEGRRFGNRIKQAAASPVLYYLPSQFRLRSFDWQLVYNDVVHVYRSEFLGPSRRPQG